MRRSLNSYHHKCHGYLALGPGTAPLPDRVVNFTTNGDDKSNYWLFDEGYYENCIIIVIVIITMRKFMI